MSQVLSWGNNKFGQLGDGTAEERLEPIIIEMFRGTKISQISSGQHHSLVVAEFGDVYVFGRGSEGQGNGERKALKNEQKDEEGRLLHGTPSRIFALRGERVIKVEAGNFHSLALTDTGKLYEWGRLYRYENEEDTSDSNDGDSTTVNGTRIRGQRVLFGSHINLPGLQSMLTRSAQSYYAAGLSLEEIEESANVVNFGNFRSFIHPIPRIVPGFEKV